MVEPRTDALVARFAPVDAVREGAPTLSDALDAFLLDRELAGRARGTLAAWKSYLKPVRLWADFGPDECRALILDRLRRNVNTAFAVHTALDRFGAWLVERKYLATNPMREIPRPRQKPPKHRYLSRDELAKVYAACDTDTNRLIVRLLLLGLRAKELLTLTWGDVDGQQLRVKTAKGGRPRKVWLDDETVRLLKNEDARTVGFASHGQRAGRPVEIPRTGSGSGEQIIPCTYEPLRRRLARLSQRSGVRFTPHDFRRTFASSALLAGMNISSVQTLGGWADDRMVRYYARGALDEAAMQDARRFSLTSRLLDDELRPADK